VIRPPLSEWARLKRLRHCTPSARPLPAAVLGEPRPRHRDHSFRPVCASHGVADARVTNPVSRLRLTCPLWLFHHVFCQILFPSSSFTRRLPSPSSGMQTLCQLPSRLALSSVQIASSASLFAPPSTQGSTRLCPLLSAKDHDLHQQALPCVQVPVVQQPPTDRRQRGMLWRQFVRSCSQELS
jgi:hypothetical protein